MKIRSDFVTNSSSSSFILAFKDKEQVAEFKEECDEYDYNKFYDVIELFGVDSLVFCNNTKGSISLNSLIDKVKNLNWPKRVSDELDSLYKKNLKIEKYERINVVVNGLGDEIFDPAVIGFQDIDEDDYEIYFDNRDSNRNKWECYQSVRRCAAFSVEADTFDIYNPEETPINANDVFAVINKFDWPDYILKQIREYEANVKVFTQYNGVELILTNFETGESFNPYEHGWNDDNISFMKVRHDVKEDKSRAIDGDILQLPMVRSYRYNLSKNFPRLEGESFDDYCGRKDTFMKSQEALMQIKNYICTEYLDECYNRIMNSLVTVSGTVWDTNGGLIEWAIRNGFIVDNFGKYCLQSWNVG